MFLYYKILNVFYYLIVTLIVGLIGWRLVKTDKFYNKVIAMLAIIMFALRLFMVR